MSELLFEYKVRARHRLGWKEFSFYATTDIEEFLNRNNIEYVRNATDTVENRLFKEIERLNNIINDFEEELEREVNIKKEDTGLEHNTYIDINNTLKTVLKRFRELKGSDK